MYFNVGSCSLRAGAINLWESVEEPALFIWAEKLKIFGVGSGVDI